MNYRILLVEDDAEFRRSLLSALSTEGHSVTVATRISDTLQWLHHPDVYDYFDLMLLDLNLPDGRGERIMQNVQTQRLPVLVTSAEDEERIKIRLLDLGADDYLVKPFSFPELLARIRASIRRQRQRASLGLKHYESDSLLIDVLSHSVILDGQAVHVTPTEFKLLERLVKDAGKVVKHRDLLLYAWGPDYVQHTHYLRLYMSQLRNKLEINAADPKYILTEPGIGYRLQSMSVAQNERGR